MPARNLVFLVDVSGSMMDDQKLPLLVRSLGRVVDQLRPEDRVSLVVYAGASGVVLEPTTGDQKDVIRGALDRLTAGGSTNGGAGIELAYRLAEQNFAKDGINRVILASDGDFNVGIADIDGLEKLIAEKRESGVFLSVLGFGSEATNDATMEALADKGNGNYSFIDSDREARKVLVDEVDSTLVTIAKDVKLQVSFDPKEVKSWRLIGYDNRRLAARDFDDDTKDAGEVGAGHSVTAIYEITPTRELRPGDELMTVAVRYKEPDGDESTRSSFSVVDRDIELSRTSEDFRFAAAVAEVGLLLRKSEHAGSAGWASALELAEGARGEDASCLRDEFVQLMRKAAVMSGAGLSPGGDSKCSA